MIKLMKFIKVKLRPPPWSLQWFMYNLKGIEDGWTQATPWYKRKFIAHKDYMDLKKFDIIQHYRNNCQELEHDLLVQQRMNEFRVNRTAHALAQKKKKKE